MANISFTIYFYFFITFFYCSFCENHKHQKRQIFREQISPDMGGKIPDSAFQSERVSLNRLSQNGFFVQDGLHLQQRSPNNYPEPKQAFPSTYKIYLDVGEHNFNPDVVDTSYLKQDSVDFIIIPHLAYQRFPLSPQHSLELMYQSKEDKLNFDNKDFYQKIFDEFTEYLQKIM